jgi:hypothetical protein
MRRDYTMVPAYVEEGVHSLQQQITELEGEIEVCSGRRRGWSQCPCLLPAATGSTG